MKFPENNTYLKRDRLAVGRVYIDNEGARYKCLACRGNEASMEILGSNINTFFVFRLINTCWYDREDRDFFLVKEATNGSGQQG